MLDGIQGFDPITIEPAKMGGQPCIRDHQFPAEQARPPARPYSLPGELTELLLAGATATRTPDRASIRPLPLRPAAGT